jgi:hypothetical protein
MRVITRNWFLILFTVACAPAIALAQREGPVGQSTITGRAIFADTGRPVRRATVKLYTDMKRSPKRMTAANVRGEFRFNEVVAGSYFVVAEAPGLLFPRSSFVINEFGISSDMDVDHTRVTVDGKNAVRCEVRVVRAGSISGTITYADKEPVVSGRIVLFRRKNGVVAPFFSEAEQTNDRGMYRVDGLPDGEYFVGVVAGQISAEKFDRFERSGVPTAFYPGVVSLSEAKPIQIQSGSEAEGISITLADEPLRQISGVVKWRQNGKPAANAAVTLRRKDQPKVDLSISSLFQSMSREDREDSSFFRDIGMLSRAYPTIAEADQQGEWNFTDLPPGTYELTAFASPPRKDKKPTSDPADTEGDGGRPEMEPERAVFRKVELTIADEDKKNVTIELPEGNRILGTVVVEGSEPVVIALMVDQRGGNEILTSIPRPTNPDGTFVIESAPTGEVILDADAPAMRDLYVKSITLGSQDLWREPLVVREGAEVSGVRITVGQGVATLTGRMQSKENGSPAASGGVLLVKSDPKLWHLSTSRVFAMTNAAGEFRVRCAPGDYLLFSWPAGGEPLQSIEDFVRAQAATARPISLASKEEKQIELTVARPRK